MKRIFDLSIIGLGIGFIATVFCMWSFGDVTKLPGGEVMRQVTGWMIASVIFGGISVIFDIERISRLAATGIHVIVCWLMVTFTSAALGYFPLLSAKIFTTLPLFIGVYAVIYLLTLLYERVSIGKINRRLQKK